AVERENGKLRDRLRRDPPGRPEDPEAHGGEPHPFPRPAERLSVHRSPPCPTPWITGTRRPLRRRSALHASDHTGATGDRVAPAVPRPGDDRTRAARDLAPPERVGLRQLSRSPSRTPPRGATPPRARARTSADPSRERERRRGQAQDVTAGDDAA